MTSRDGRDILGGVLMISLGLFFALQARLYAFGDAARMGPGYFPTLLGWVLAALGLLILLPALFRRGEAIVVRWKSLCCVIGSVLFFAWSLPRLGLVLGVAGAVVLASLADNEITWKGRLLLAAAVPVVMVLVFVTGLQMNLPLLPGAFNA